MRHLVGQVGAEADVESEVTDGNVIVGVRSARLQRRRTGKVVCRQPWTRALKPRKFTQMIRVAMRTSNVEQSWDQSYLMEFCVVLVNGRMLDTKRSKTTWRRR